MKSLYYYFIPAMLLVMAICSCQDFKEVEVTGIEGFKMNKINTEGLEAEIRLGVKNPNMVGFSIYPSEFDIVYCGVPLGVAKLKKRVHIDANCEKSYGFELKSSFKGIGISDLTKIISSSKSGLMEVKGNLKAGKFWLKKSFPVNRKERTGFGM